MARREDLELNIIRTNNNTRILLPGNGYTAAPTTGTWKIGDTVFNDTPTAGGTLCWVCTTAGTPGTWKAVAIAA